MKWCSTCKKWQPKDEFGKDASRCLESERERARRYRKANPDKKREQNHRYYVTNKTLHQERDLRRRARKADAETDGHTMAELSESWNERDFYGCYWCGADLADGFHVDHVIPLSRGGPHTVHNLVPACPECNLSKGDKMPITEWSPPDHE